ncbi:hypothetical protein [Usitatibacter palustris]|uniref:Uncharacterized protein n=1 Tax=Usitatibacter palustris TaxID=2732487 RepID=A0A6M4H369_9PROT|nr:hypothetical protein [Usitatibacter palustris]QJR13976.1 hypothetical protein DSM104440_00768 [Usitatibacter palustris]
MGLFGKLFSKDPTADWPPPEGRLPAFDPSTGKFGPLRFGDPLEAARALGKPLSYEGGTNMAILKYASGVTLDFEDGKFVNLCFNTAPEVAAHGGQRPAVGSVGGLPVSEATTPEDAIGWMGEPDEREEDADDDSIAFTYRRGKITIYFEFEKDVGLSFLDITADD